MIKYLIDKNEKRDIVLFYSNKLKSEINYANIENYPILATLKKNHNGSASNKWHQTKCRNDI